MADPRIRLTMYLTPEQAARMAVFFPGRRCLNASMADCVRTLVDQLPGKNYLTTAEAIQDLRNLGYRLDLNAKQAKSTGTVLPKPIPVEDVIRHMGDLHEGESEDDLY